jgi:lysophospholipase L1-like esterase
MLPFSRIDKHVTIWREQKIYDIIIEYIATLRKLMKKVTLFIILLILATFSVYLNRSYAYIYDEIGNGNLKAPAKNQTNMIGENINNQDLTYVALGDSLTAGAGTESYKESYPYILSEKLSGKNNVILKNRSELGYKSIDVKNVFLPLAVKDNPAIVTLFVGVNDVHNNISKEEFAKNYEDILKSLATETKAKIYAINLPFIGASNLILPPYNLYFDFKTKELNEVIKNLSQKYNTVYIDLYSPTKEKFAKSNSYYSKDLFHPSAKGYALWANIIYANFNQ